MSFLEDAYALTRPTVCRPPPFTRNTVPTGVGTSESTGDVELFGDKLEPVKANGTIAGPVSVFGSFIDVLDNVGNGARLGGE